MKNKALIAALMLITIVCGCLKNKDVPPPVMTISQAPDEILNFSTIQSADVEVRIESGNELTMFTTNTVPISSWSDTIVQFDPYTHRAVINLSYKAWKGLRVTSRDSIYDVTYTAYTEEDTVTLKRKLRYRYIYPELDSFDLKVESVPNGHCLIDIDNRCTYKYSEYSQHSFDLVYVNEREADHKFGTALISPDAPYLKRYFQRVFPSMEYDAGPRKSTQCGIIIDDIAHNKIYTWDDFSSSMLGDENNCNWFDRICSLSPMDGVGVYDLQRTKLYKFRLQNGRFIMIRVLERIWPQYANQSEMKLRIYLQQ